MPHSDPSVVLSLVDKLYAAAVTGAKWSDFLSSAAEAVGADHAFVCQLDHHQRSLSYVGLQQGNRSAVPVRRYGALLDDDPRRAIFDSRPDAATHCRMGLSDARLRGSRTYRNYLRPLRAIDELPNRRVINKSNGRIYKNSFPNGSRPTLDDQPCSHSANSENEASLSNQVA